jgi:YidC/Oxa1 family membrane protein insertase
VSFLNPLYHAVAFLLVGIHKGLGHIFGFNNGWGWALSIVLLTVGMRLVLFPIFVRQIKTQRAMQAIQPKMKELQAKYKNDKERLNQEMMALWKEAGANPFSGCLPLVLQIPIFISLFHTLRAIKPINSHCNTHMESCFSTKVPGFSQHDIFSAAHAKVFGVPISVSFSTSKNVIAALGGHQGSVRILAMILTVIMAATTFITQRQLMARNTGDTNSQMAQQQKILLYIFPLLFFFYGFKFPIGVLLYWLTTNVWSMGQQRIVIRRQEALGPVVPATGAGPAPGAKPKGARGSGASAAPEPKAPPAGPAPGAKPRPAGSGSNVVLPPGGAIPASPGPSRPTTPKPSGSSNSSNARPNRGRSNKRKRGRR